MVAISSFAGFASINLDALSETKSADLVTSFSPVNISSPPLPPSVLFTECVNPFS